MTYFKRVTIEDENGDIAVVSDDGSLQIVAQGKLTTNNSSTTPLGIDGVFTGTSEFILDSNALAIFVTSDTAGVLEIQYSRDGVNDWRTAEQYIVLANAEKWYTPPAFGAYMRIIYTNGSVAQTTFELTTILRKVPIKWSSHNIEEPIRDEDDAELVKSVLTGKQDNGEYDNASLTNLGHFKVAVNEFGDTPSIDAFARLRISEPFTLFDSKQLYDKQPLFWDESIGGAATSVHSTVNAETLMSVTENSSDFVIRQSKQRPNYQPGKALALSELVLTISGWKEIKDINVGDEVFDGKGEITEVVAIKEWENRDVYRLTFDDGTTIDADENHEWVTIIRQNSKKGQERIITTKEMLEEYGEEPPVFARWKIPASPILKTKEKDVEIDPYTLGAILGDGYIDKNNGFVIFTTADEEILDYLCFEKTKYENKPMHYGLKGTGAPLKKLGLIGRNFIDKYIPKEYLYNSPEIRLSILQGLMDTDGTVDKRDGCCEFNSASKQLAEDLAFLVRSLGGQAKIRQRAAGYKNASGDYVACSDSYRVRVISPVCPFRLRRKANLWSPRKRISFDRYVHTIRYLGKEKTKCIQVASENHTFLTRNNIVTHNSQLLFLTFRSPQASGVTTRVGCFDGTGTNNLTPNNGIFFEADGTVSWNVAKNGTTTETVAQSNWNVDPLDGTGPSGITLDLDACLIAIIDYEWLGVGRIRVGFVIDGVVRYVHYFNHANDDTFTKVYMSTPNLPVRYDIQASGTNVASNFAHICSTVISEGGQQKTGILRAIDTGVTHLDIDENQPSVVIGVRLKSTHLDLTVIPESISVINEQNDDFRWALCLNPTYTGTVTWTDVSNSGVQQGIGATANNVTDEGIVIASGYASIDTLSVSQQLQTALRIGSTISGTPDELVLIVTPLSAGADIQAALNFRELL
jgi:hypothetical protein